MTSEALSKKQIILHAAADLFSKKGYNAATIRDLASMVGLEPSSIYSHIRSKEDLLIELCMTCANQFMEGINNISSEEMSSRKKLKALILLHLDIAYLYPASAIVFNDEWRFLPPQELQEFLHLRKAYEKKFKKILITGKEEGKFFFDHTDIVFNIILNTLNYTYKGVKQYDKNELEETLSHFILNFLNKP